MLNNMKIRSAFIISLISVILLIVAIYLFVYIEVSNTLKASLIARGRDSVASLTLIQVQAHISTDIFSEQDLGKTQETFKNFFPQIDTNEILRIKVWNKHAEIIAANDPTLVGKSFADNRLFQRAIKGEVVVEIKSPIAQENIREVGYGQLMAVYVPITAASGEIVGIVETYTILDKLNEQINIAQNQLLEKFLIVTLLLLGLLSGIFFFLYRSITRKINMLISHTKKIGEGNLYEKINVHSDDELSEMAIAINLMSDNLSTTLTSKTDLEQQIANRTAELQSKIDELARMNKLMVNHEIKMVELKKEIASLKGLSDNTSK